MFLPSTSSCQRDRHPYFNLVPTRPVQRETYTKSRVSPVRSPSSHLQLSSSQLTAHSPKCPSNLFRSFRMAEGAPLSPGLSDLDDLPSPSTDTTSTTSHDEQGESDADREWRESLQQLELLLTMVLIPYMGKYYGRKFAYWGE